MKKIILVALLGLSFVSVRCEEVQKIKYELTLREKVIEAIEVFAFTCMIVVTSILLLVSLSVMYQLTMGLCGYFGNKNTARITFILDYLGRWLLCGMLTDIFLFGIVVVSNFLMPQVEKEIKWLKN